MNKLEGKIDELPCAEHLKFFNLSVVKLIEGMGNNVTEIASLKTTNRNLKYGVSLFITAMGVAMGVLGWAVIT